MNIQPGIIITSAPALQDPNFEKAVIVITEYNDNGALGFVVNKPFARRLNELVEFKNAAPFALFAGGPVDTENLFVLHRRTDLVTGNKFLFRNVYMGGDFQQIIQCINKGSLTNNDIKLFIGYCGWDAGELEAEIEEGSWIVTETDDEIIFNKGEGCWEKLNG
jgi:putative transcriptional regulator